MIKYKFDTNLYYKNNNEIGADWLVSVRRFNVYKLKNIFINIVIHWITIFLNLQRLFEKYS